MGSVKGKKKAKVKQDQIKRTRAAARLVLRPDTVDLVGMRFGKVQVKAVAGRTVFPGGQSRLRWLVECDCGETFKVEGHRIRAGKVTGCPTCRDAERAVAPMCGKVPFAVLADAQGVTVGALQARRRRGWTDAELVAGARAA